MGHKSKERHKKGQFSYLSCVKETNVGVLSLLSSITGLVLRDSFVLVYIILATTDGR